VVGWFLDRVSLLCPHLFAVATKEQGGRDTPRAIEPIHLLWVLDPHLCIFIVDRTGFVDSGCVELGSGHAAGVIGGKAGIWIEGLFRIGKVTWEP
jgi:hypothetical protein